MKYEIKNRFTRAIRDMDAIPDVALNAHKIGFRVFLSLKCLTAADTLRIPVLSHPRPLSVIRPKTFPNRHADPFSQLEWSEVALAICRIMSHEIREPSVELA